MLLFFQFSNVQKKVDFIVVTFKSVGDTNNIKKKFNKLQLHNQDPQQFSTKCIFVAHLNTFLHVS